jgi:Xaa-Pro aminopeptidase
MPSFATISSYGANGAIIHYHPTEATNSLLGTESLFLCDSGGHYLSETAAGTTDVTRTLHFGTPTEHQKKCYTRVLRGHIALATAVFPAGTTGHMLDILARTPLWQAGLDYRHGTGHGVGALLCVHEGPHLVSYYPRDPDPPLKAGMTSSIEPGYYEEGMPKEPYSTFKRAVVSRNRDLLIVAAAQAPLASG